MFLIVFSLELKCIDKVFSVYILWPVFYNSLVGNSFAGGSQNPN